MAISRDGAETLALRALGWLMGQDDLRGVFLGATGLGEADLRGRATDPELLASILDFLLMDDAWIIGFCNAEGLSDYDSLRRARAALPGGDEVHWT
jgi:hypothetical protein